MNLTIKDQRLGKDRIHTKKVLGERLLTNPGVGPAIRSDEDLNGKWPALEMPSTFRDAAVLVPILDRGPDLTVLFTKRPEHMDSHAGQICFPGGKVDEVDLGPAEAALREAEEEVGLPPHLVDIIGYLDAYETGSGFRIQPVVGIVEQDFSIIANPHEVEEVFEVPFSFFLDGTNHERHQGVFNGIEREYYAQPYGDYYIWGATAGMLKSLYDRLV